jgi:hypothetical protein
MIAELNRLIDVIDDDLSEDLDIGALAREAGVTEYHLRRMFSSLVGMPLSEYIRSQPPPWSLATRSSISRCGSDTARPKPLAELFARSTVRRPPRCG